MKESAICYSNRIIAPPPRSPHWSFMGNLPLVYLGWGKRYYRSNPIPISPHPGWPHLVILGGSSTLKTKTKSYLVQKGDLFIQHPECQGGWDSTTDEACQILSFIWKRSPSARLNVLRSKPLFGKATDHELTLLKEIHRKCREEVTSRAPFMEEALEALYCELQVLMLRVMLRDESEKHFPLEKQLIEQAVRWMKEHLSLSNSVSDLHHYLEIEPKKLALIFKEQMGISPEDYFHALRMSKAILLRETMGHSQKEIAFELGYRHANDLSRALRQYRERGSILLE